MAKKTENSRNSSFTRIVCLVLAGLMIISTLAAVIFTH